MGVVIMGHSFQSSISTWSGKLLQFNLQMYTHPAIVESGQWRLPAFFFFHWGMLEIPVYLYDKIKDSSTSLRFELLQSMGVKPVTSKAYTSKTVSDGLALWLLASHRGFLLQRLELFDFPYFPRVFQRIYVMVCPLSKTPTCIIRITSHYSFDVGLHTRCVSGACHHGERERGRRRWMMQCTFLHGDLLIVWILMSQLPGVAWIVQDNQSDCNGIVLQRCGAWIQEGNILMLQGWSKRNWTRLTA